jgi:hypothetical protein
MAANKKLARIIARDRERAIWLGSVLREAVQSAIASDVPVPRADYVIGFIVGRAKLDSLKEADDLMHEACKKRGSYPVGSIWRVRWEGKLQSCTVTRRREYSLEVLLQDGRIVTISDERLF